jgi:hypothetical protein
MPRAIRFLEMPQFQGATAFACPYRGASPKRSVQVWDTTGVRYTAERAALVEEDISRERIRNLLRCPHETRVNLGSGVPVANREGLASGPRIRISREFAAFVLLH